METTKYSHTHTYPVKLQVLFCYSVFISDHWAATLDSLLKVRLKKVTEGSGCFPFLALLLNAWCYGEDSFVRKSIARLAPVSGWNGILAHFNRPGVSVFTKEALARVTDQFRIKSPPSTRRWCSAIGAKTLFALSSTASSLYFHWCRAGKIVTRLLAGFFLIQFSHLINQYWISEASFKSLNFILISWTLIVRYVCVIRSTWYATRKMLIKIMIE